VERQERQAQVRRVKAEARAAEIGTAVRAIGAKQGTPTAVLLPQVDLLGAELARAAPVAALRARQPAKVAVQGVREHQAAIGVEVAGALPIFSRC